MDDRSEQKKEEETFFIYPTYVSLSRDRNVRDVRDLCCFERVRGRCCKYNRRTSKVPENDLSKDGTSSYDRSVIDMYYHIHDRYLT